MNSYERKGQNLTFILYHSLRRNQNKNKKSLNQNQREIHLELFSFPERCLHIYNFQSLLSPFIYLFLTANLFFNNVNILFEIAIISAWSARKKICFPSIPNPKFPPQLIKVVSTTHSSPLHNRPLIHILVTPRGLVVSVFAVGQTLFGSNFGR